MIFQRKQKQIKQKLVSPLALPRVREWDSTDIFIYLIELAYQEFAWSASEICLPAFGCGEGSDHQEMTEQTKMRKRRRESSTGTVSPHGRLSIGFET